MAWLRRSYTWGQLQGMWNKSASPPRQARARRARGPRFHLPIIGWATPLMLPVPPTS